MTYKKLGEYIQVIDDRNRDLLDLPLLGVSVQKVFIPSIANTVGTDMSKYKILSKNQFTYIPDTSRRGDKIGVALLKNHERALVSQAYTTFKIIDEEKLNPDYLMMWFTRPEFDRYARYHSIGSVREVFDWEDMCEVELPIPSIEKQREIVAQYEAVANKIKVNEAICKKLEATAQALYKHWFVEGIDENSEKIQLNELVQTQYGYTETASTEVIGPKFLRITDIAQHYIDWTNVPYCKISESDFKKYKLKAGDIVVARTGATAGYAKRLHKQIPDCVFASFLVRLIPNESKWDLFLGLTVDSQIYRDFILSNAGGSAQPQANAILLTSFEIYKPDESKVLEFNRLVEPIFDLIENHQLENQKLVEVQSLLLSRLAREE